MRILRFIDKIRPGILISSLFVLALSSAFIYDRCSINSKINNLEPGALWVGQYCRVSLINEDLDSNGKYETVIRYTGRDNIPRELELRLDESDTIRVIDPNK